MKVKYDALLSLWIFFIFFTALFFRMTWKYDYNFNHELIDLNDPVGTYVSSYINNFTSYNVHESGEFKNSIIPYANDLERIIINNQDARTDYIYLLEREKEDIDIFLHTNFTEVGDESYKIFLSAYKDFTKINSSYRTLKVFSIISLIGFGCSFTPWIILKVQKKNKEQNLTS